MRYTNPILYGDYSDPDVIRVKDDFYMISSSFTYFPGLPVLHSRDLVHWELISYACRRLPFSSYGSPRHSCGIWAPSLRYHDGRFFIYVCTVTDYVKNSSSEIPEFETLEELAAYLEANQPVIDKITYYPTFGSLTMVNLYDRNRYAALYDYTYTEGMVFAQNPEAAGQWNNMQKVFGIMTELANGADSAALNEQIAALEFLPQSKSKIWQACVSENEYSSAFN